MECFMDVNSINNNISTLNNPSSLQLEKSISSSKVSKNNKDALNLTINDYNKKRDELSLSVQSLNNGIGMTNVAQNAIEKQQIKSVTKIDIVEKKIPRRRSY